jgi:sarcosine oxidase
MPNGKRYDAIVVGIGGLGSSVLYHLARRGGTVLGIDRFAPPHDRGSSHGHTRIYRQAYYEAPEYVPLALRALDLWRALERDTGRRLFANTGALTIGPADGELFSGALRSAREHGIAHDVLTAAEALRRFPAFRPPPETAALFEPTGGVLFVDACVEGHLHLARKHGAHVLTNEAVLGVDQHKSGTVEVTTGRAVYEATHVIVAAGAWAPKLMGFEAAVRVTREMVHWFTPSSPSAAAASCPVSMIDDGGGPILYTLPDFGDGFKAGLHHGGKPADPLIEASADEGTDADVVAARVAEYAPGGAGALRTSAPCFYTTTRDHHFAIGPLPDSPAVILASACSGHGFKFASVLGEAIAALVSGEATLLPRSLFDAGRIR